MCGRFTITNERAVLEQRFRARFDAAVFVPRYNAAPSQSLPVILNTQPQVIQSLLWGLRPAWLKQVARREGLINVREETLRDKQTFARDVAQRRCLVLADGFYEWKKTEKQKTPYRFQLKTGEPFAFAGIWEANEDEDGHTLFTFALITIASNALVAQVHNRMPVILTREAEPVWLDTNTTREHALSLLTPYPARQMRRYEISPRVNRATEDTPELIKAVEEGERGFSGSRARSPV
jgi:putative SOS response-associated peptidase YedK